MDETVPVLIVGGSLVGLTASVLLGHHGVPHMLIERHSGTAIHPRAAAFHQRTLEVFRNVGLQQAVEEAAEREFEQDGAILSVDTLGGRELAWFYRSVNDGVEHLSPARRIFITQIGLEPVLRSRAVELGADLRFSTELAEFEQDEGGVIATIRSRTDGTEQRVRARYMIAADGAHSRVRQALGICMGGRGDFANCATIYFRADVRPLLRGRNMSVVYVNQPGLLAFFRFSITGDAGFLAVFATFDADGRREEQAGRGLSQERATELVRAALGVAEDFAVTIENIQSWTATAATADSFRRDCIFLAGDAAHLMPPTGGFGGNTGAADVHNLAWKLAMVLDGHADPALLDSYEAERRPIAEMTVEQAYRRYVERVDPTLPADNLAPNLTDTAIELGAVYGAGAELTEAPEEPSGRPGARLRHLWIEQAGKRFSTLDLAGRGFALLTGPDGAGWMEAGRAAALDVHRIDDPTAATALGLAGEGALILRPDGVIGWRTDALPADPRSTLQSVIHNLGGWT